VPRNRDTHYPFGTTAISTGSPVSEPEAVVVLVGGKEPRHDPVLPRANEEREIWDGFRYGPEAARETFGFRRGLLLRRARRGTARAAGKSAALPYHRPRPAWDNQVMGWLNAVRSKARSGISAPNRLVDARICSTKCG
jgi:Xaa-Pro aminopeptidase